MRQNTSKIPLILLSTILIIIGYIFIPLMSIFPGISDKEELVKNINHKLDTNLILKLDIVDISKYPLIYTIYNDYFFPGTDGLYRNNKIYLIYEPNKYSAFFHEYLHYIYDKRKLSLEEKKDILKTINSNIYSEEMYLTLSIIENYTIDVSITEYISHIYDGYYNICKQKKDLITDKLLEYNLLPEDIYCKEK